MTCSKSFALGRWRGLYRKPRAVRLIETICLASYEEGYAAGRQDRIAQDAARPPRGRR